MHKWFSVQTREIVSGIPNCGSDVHNRSGTKTEDGITSEQSWAVRTWWSLGPSMGAGGHIFSAFLHLTKLFRWQLSRGQEKDGILTIIICLGKLLYPARNDGKKGVWCAFIIAQSYLGKTTDCFFLFFCNDDPLSIWRKVIIICHEVLCCLASLSNVPGDTRLVNIPDDRKWKW